MGRSQTGPTRRSDRCLAPWLLPVAITLVATFCHFLPNASALLEFDRAAITHGELWRLLSGHFVHFDASHLVWDVGTFVLLAGLLPPLSARRWFVLVVGSALFISAGVGLLQPQFEIYRGLSGIDCALFGALLCEQFRRARRERDRFTLAVVALASAGFVAKCGVELFKGVPVFATAGAYSTVPLAHLLGAIFGALVTRSGEASTPGRDSAARFALLDTGRLGLSPSPSSQTRRPNPRLADARACKRSARS
ncbi:MAG TPA: rhombosortase [Acidobacteriota bacterium]|nr:rhombosortase [Acidobacteriota bacterium]